MNQVAQAQRQGVPRGVLISAAALVAFSLGATWFARNSGVGGVRMPTEEAYQIRHLDFVDAEDGGVLVRDAASGAVVYRVAPGTNGFLRSALRGFAHERMRDGIGSATPFTLTRWRDGTESLADETTGRRIDLDAFGPTQAEAFAQLLVAKEAVK